MVCGLWVGGLWAVGSGLALEMGLGGGGSGQWLVGSGLALEFGSK